MSDDSNGTLEGYSCLPQDVWSAFAIAEVGVKLCRHLDFQWKVLDHQLINVQAHSLIGAWTALSIQDNW